MAIFKIDTEIVKNVSDSIMRLKTEATEIVNSVSNYNTSAINEFHNISSVAEEAKQNIFDEINELSEKIDKTATHLIEVVSKHEEAQNSIKSEFSDIEGLNNSNENSKSNSTSTYIGTTNTQGSSSSIISSITGSTTITGSSSVSFPSTTTVTYANSSNTSMAELQKKVKEQGFIAKADFLDALKITVDSARNRGYTYGNSTSKDPTTDGKISCDRMISKALYDLGLTDQVRGGETCGTFDKWLGKHGFTRSTSLADAKQSSILLVKHTGKNEKTPGHMFVAASNFTEKNGKYYCDRFDCGSNEFIRREQPIKNLNFWYRTDDVIVYNFPENGIKLS
jgi:hypothetical protein